MRWIGVLMLIAGCSGVGIGYRNRYYERMKELSSLIWFFHYMESEVAYHRAPMAQICGQAGGRLKEPVGSVLQDIGEQMASGRGRDFERIWRDGMEILATRSQLRPEDMEPLRDFTMHGFADPKMQITQIYLVREALAAQLSGLQENAASRCRVYLCLGSMSGVLLSIILL